MFNLIQSHYVIILICYLIVIVAVVTQSVRAFTLHAERSCLNPNRDRPKSLNQEVKAPVLESSKMTIINGCPVSQ